MIQKVDTNDRKAVRNMNNVLQVYELLINQQRVPEVATLLDSGYIQHNPITPDTAQGLLQFWSKITKERALAHAVVHRIIAVDDYVWAHVNFLNLFNDDPHDTGIAGVDIFKMNADGKALEHWDCLQLVGSENNAAPWLGPDLPRATPHRMF